MRKLTYILAGLILAVTMVSCEKEKVNPQGNLVGVDGVVKSQMVSITEPGESAPDSDGGTTPYLIPGKNNGGNRTCEEAQIAFNSMAAEAGHEFEGLSLGEFTDCGEKVDIDDDYVGPVAGFPFEVKVNDDGSIWFDVGDSDCQVKAVIVKGSNQANVYYYPGGALADDGLAAPAFDMEAPERFPWVSNVTFCCECDEVEEELWYAVKVRYDDDDRWAISDGSTTYYSGTDHWCDHLGFGVYPGDDMNLIDKAIMDGITTDVGDITVDVSGNVIITLDASLSLTLSQASLYVGEMDDLGPTNPCPNYEATPWAFKDNLASNTVTFVKGVDF